LNLILIINIDNIYDNRKSKLGRTTALNSAIIFLFQISINFHFKHC